MGTPSRLQDGLPPFLPVVLGRDPSLFVLHGVLHQRLQLNSSSTGHWYPGHWRLVTFIIWTSLLGGVLVSGRELRPRRLPEDHAPHPDCQPCCRRTCCMRG